jgi:CheY-like chemotaxis protein
MVAGGGETPPGHRAPATAGVVLPAGASSTDGPATGASPANGFERPPPRRGRILVVDDEVNICKTFQHILAPDHEIVTETSAQEAVRRIESNERFDVIFCDFTMPKMNGMDLYKRLAETAPEQAKRVVFITGGAFTQVAADFLNHVPNRCLEKPFSAQEIRAIVREQEP